MYIIDVIGPELAAWVVHEHSLGKLTAGDLLQKLHECNIENPEKVCEAIRRSFEEALLPLG